MQDHYRRSLAPLTPEGWQEVDSAATQILSGQLSARKIVDVDGPHGLEFAAVNLGRLELAKGKSVGDVPWGLRQVQPLIELRIPVTLSQMEIDGINRGSADPDLGNLEDGTRKLALFEESAIYNGFDAGKIEGIIPAAGHTPLPLPGKIEELTHTVAEGVKTLRQAGIGGPYALVLGTESYFELMQAGRGSYPPKRIIRDTLEGEIHWSPAVKGGVLLSARGGDFELVLGQDIAIGYASHDRDNVELYLTESFTFRVLEPAAAIALRVKG